MTHPLPEKHIVTGEPMVQHLESYPGVPPAILEGLQLYVVDGIRPGSFLQAVLRNDLMDAIARADPVCLRAIQRVCELVYNRCPATCWGSAEAMDNWIAHRREHGS